MLRLLVATVILKGTQTQKSVLGDKSNNRSSVEGGKRCLTQLSACILTLSQLPVRTSAGRSKTCMGFARISSPAGFDNFGGTIY